MALVKDDQTFPFLVVGQPVLDLAQPAPWVILLLDLATLAGLAIC